MEKFKALLAVALFVAALLFSAFEKEANQKAPAKPEGNQQLTPKPKANPVLFR